MADVADFADQVLLSPHELVDALAAHEQRAGVLALAVAHVASSGTWAAEGAVSMNAWLRDQCAMSGRVASEWLRRGRLLNEFPAFADAAVNRTLSASQLGELERLNKPKYRDLLREHAEMLAGSLGALDAEDTRRACDDWLQKADAILEGDEPPLEPERTLSVVLNDDGTTFVRGNLDDYAGTEVRKAIDTARTGGGEGEERSQQERNADALTDICAFFNKNHDGDGTPRHTPNVSLSMDADSLEHGPTAVNDDEQQVVCTATADAKLCDCILHKVLRDGAGAPLGFGRAQYTVPRALFRQVAARDGGCRFPGCNRKVRHTEAHHIIYWRHHGLTEYRNLVLLCSRHHHYVHQQRLQLKLLPHGQLVVTWLDGRERTSEPRGAPPRGSKFQPPIP